MDCSATGTASAHTTRKNDDCFFMDTPPEIRLLPL